VIGICVVVDRQLSHREVSVTWVVCSTVVSGSLPMSVPVHGSVGSTGIITLASHTSRLLAIDRRQR
jgi:hypothetical protein